MMVKQEGSIRYRLTEIDDVDDRRRRMFPPAKAFRKISFTNEKECPKPLTTAIQMWYLCSVRFMNTHRQFP